MVQILNNCWLEKKYHQWPDDQVQRELNWQQSLGEICWEQMSLCSTLFPKLLTRQIKTNQICLWRACIFRFPIFTVCVECLCEPVRRCEMMFQHIPLSVTLPFLLQLPSLLPVLKSLPPYPLAYSLSYISPPFSLPVVSYGFQTFPLSSLSILCTLMSTLTLPHWPQQRQDPSSFSRFLSLL